jgi:hypothetical protein
MTKQLDWTHLLQVDGLPPAVEVPDDPEEHLPWKQRAA